MRPLHFAVLVVGAGLLPILVACGPKNDVNPARVDTSATSVAAVAKRDSAKSTAHADSGTAQMPGMDMSSQPPDQQFLRMMSDHHKGLTLMAHETIERKDKIAVKEEARAMDKKQDLELDEMVIMLDTKYKDSYTPKVTPDNRAMVDDLMTKSGREFDRAFRENVIKHHEQAIRMIDQYLPKLTDPKLREMALKMKTDQKGEIAQQQKKLGSR